MTIQPTQANLLIRLHHTKPDSAIMVPDDSSLDLTYGEVIAHGPDCKFITTNGQFVLFLPGNMVAGFDQGKDEKFIIPEAAVFAMYLPDAAS